MPPPLEKTMIIDETARDVAQRLATAGAGAPIAARTLAELRRRVHGDKTAEAILTLFEGNAGSADMQRRIAQLLTTRFSAAELHAVLAALRGNTAAPQVRSRISADEDALIQSSGHKVIAQPGTVNLETSAGKRGRIIDSPITIIGAGVKPAPTAAAPRRPRPVLPPTLSADGEHFTYGHALLIGVGDYQRDSLSTPTTAADATRLAELLRDAKVAAYPEKQVQTVLDAQATRAGILAALDAFAQQLAGSPQATAVVFFAGHGKQHENGYYLLPHDYTPKDVAGTAISAAEFHAKIDAIRQHAKKLIVLLNCCHSGGVGDHVLDDTAGEGAGDTPPADFYQPLAIGSGQVVISAARPRQKAGAASFELPEHTVFGARLLDALRGHIPGDAPAIGVFELFSYLSMQVPTDAKHIYYKGAPLAQEPLLYAHQLDSNIALALRPNWQGGTLSDDLHDVVQQLAEVEVALAGYASAEAAPKKLLKRRDELLAQLEHAS
jgi:uncharacterized caspase-like protein